MLHPWRSTSMVTESEERPIVGDDLHQIAPPAVQPSSVWLGVRMVMTARAAGRSIGCSVVAFDQAEEVLDAALVNVERVDMSEVVIEKDLDSVRIEPNSAAIFAPRATTERSSRSSLARARPRK